MFHATILSFINKFSFFLHLQFLEHISNPNNNIVHMDILRNTQHTKKMSILFLSLRFWFNTFLADKASPVHRPNVATSLKQRRWRFVVLRRRRKSFDVSRPVLPDWTIFWKLLATNFLTKVVQMFVDLWAFLKTSLLRKNYCLGNIWKVWATFLFQHLVSLTCYRSFGLMSYLMLVDRSDWWWTWHCHFQELKGSKITNLWWKFD